VAAPHLKVLQAESSSADKPMLLPTMFQNIIQILDREIILVILKVKSERIFTGAVG